MRMHTCGLAGVLLSSIFLASCLAGGDARCGPGQQLTEDGLCECAPGFALDQDGQCATPAADPAVDAGEAGADAGDVSGSVDAGLEPSLGQPCTSPEDCGPDAPFCDTFHYNACLVPGCVLEPDDCPSGWECCDLSVFQIEEKLCVRADECPTR